MGFNADGRAMSDPGEMGRPATKFNEKELIGMMKIQCTREEIAYVYNVHPDTLDDHIRRRYGRTFSDMYKEHSAEGRISLRRKLYHLAIEAEKEETQFKASQWLSKQYLGMKDQVQTEIIPLSPYIIRGLEGEVIKLGSDKPKLEDKTDEQTCSDTLRTGDDIQP